MIGSSYIGSSAIGDIRNKILTGVILASGALFNQSGVAIASDDDVTGSIIQRNVNFTQQGILTKTYDSINLTGTISGTYFSQSGSIDLPVSNLTSYSTNNNQWFNSSGNLGLSADTISFISAVSRLSNFRQSSTILLIPELIESRLSSAMPLFYGYGEVSISNKSVNIEGISSSSQAFNQSGDLRASFEPTGYLSSSGQPFLTTLRGYVINASCTINPFTVACNGLLQEGQISGCYTTVVMENTSSVNMALELSMNIDDTSIEELINDLDTNINNTLEADLCQ